MVLFVIVLGLLNYFSSLQYYFSQDDFIHMYSSHAGNLGQFLIFFNPFAQFTDIFFYRPLGTQVYFFINQTIFGINPLPFHIEALLLHGINGFLFYLIIKNIWQRKDIALLASFFYTISAIHFLSLYYISAFQQIFRTFFMFLAILTFLQYQESGSKKNLFIALFAYVGALLSKETAIILPVLILPIVVLKKNEYSWKFLKTIILKLIPFGVIAIVYLIVRIIGFQTIFNEGAYSINFSPVNILQNLKWYFLWVVGLPEIIATYPSIKPDSWIQFMKDFNYGFGILLSFGILLVSIFVISFGSLNRNLISKQVVTLVTIFLIPLCPVLILNGHKYPQYLDLSVLAVFPILAMLTLPLNKNFLPKTLLIGSFIVLQILSVRVSEESHWTTHRSEVAEFYHAYLIQNYPKIQNNSQVIFLGDPTQLKEVSFALAQNYAIYAWYSGKMKETQYLNKSTTTDIEGIIVPITKF